MCPSVLGMVFNGLSEMTDPKQIILYINLKICWSRGHKSKEFLNYLW